ncbi:acyltransferase [Spartinivicinus ruber]|uniref:acyltransferase n=1 Tax=Spartinivicinus ruber TaxID=2683272 RepID=UPI0013D53742|nr:acyltransferase [Spartinivicinus ruber]
MLKKLPPPIKGCIASLMLALNTIILSCPLLIIALLKLLIPIKAWQQACAKILIKIAELWMSINSLWMKLTQQLTLDIKGLSSLKKDGWYLVTSNHQSWADITLLQHVLNRRIPMLKFFIKQELFWVPVIGLCWWALDFPFMKRYSKAYLEKHPEKKGQDLATTRKACEKFKETPVAVFNFIEGTRFTEEKHRDQQSPFNHLLKPKAGGIGFALGAMGDQLKSLLDITIYYPEKQLSYWDFLCGKINDIAIRIEQIEIPKEFLNKDYINDGQFREQFQLWVTELWEKKDQLLGELSKQKPSIQH